MIIARAAQKGNANGARSSLLFRKGSAPRTPGREEPLPPCSPEAAHTWHSGREKAKPKRYSVKKIFTLKTPSFAEMDKFPLYFSTIMRMLFMPKP